MCQRKLDWIENKNWSIAPDSIYMEKPKKLFAWATRLDTFAIGLIIGLIIGGLYVYQMSAVIFNPILN